MMGMQGEKIRWECLAGRMALREPQIMQPYVVLQEAAVLTGWPVCRLKVTQGVALGRSPRESGLKQGTVLYRQLALRTLAGRPA